MIEFKKVEKRNGKTYDYCNFCVERPADYSITYGSVNNNKCVVVMCSECKKELQKQMEGVEK